MALTCEFNIETDLKPELILKLMLNSIGLEPTSELSPDGSPLDTRVPGFLVGAGFVGASGLSLYQERLDLSPTVALGFWIDKFSDTHAVITMILKGALAILRQLPDDAAMVFNGGIVMFLRKGGRLFLSGEWWDAERLALVDMPYERKDIPGL